MRIWQTFLGDARFALRGLAKTRVMRGLVFGVEPTDGFTFVAVTLVLLGTALIASYLPARRAARIDPLSSIRTE